MVMGFSLTIMWSPRARASAKLEYLDVDALVVSSVTSSAARRALPDLMTRVREGCGSGTGEDAWVPCAVGQIANAALSAGDGAPIVVVGKEAIVDSTVSGAILTGRGNCAALAGTVFLLGGASPRVEALVTPGHVSLRSKASGHVFELLEEGRIVAPDDPRVEGAEVLSSEDFPSYYVDNLAVRLSTAGQFDEAENLFRRALAATSDSRRIHFNFGTFLLDRGREDEALPHLEAAARGRKGLPEADLNRGVALSKLGRTADAERAFRRCLRRDPKNLMAQENLRRLAPGTDPP